MNIFTANLKNELFKLAKRKKYFVLLVLGCLVSVASALRVLIANYITHGGISREVILGGLMNSNLFFVLLGFLPLIAIMASCDLLVGEQADHTIRFSLMRPVAKWKLYFSKVGAVLLLCVGNLAVLWCVTSVTQVVLGGGTSGLFSSLLACLLDLIPLFVLVLFFALVNQVIKSTSLAVLLCVVLHLGFIVMGTYLPVAGGLLFTGYLQWHNLWLGTMLPLGALLPRIGLLFGYGLVFGSAGYLLFERKEA